MYMPERPLSFPARKTCEIKELTTYSPVGCRRRPEGGEAMGKERKGWISVKTWLFRPQFAIWGEGVVEGLIFSLIALGMWRVVLD